MPQRTSRRDFLQVTAATGIGFWVAGGVQVADLRVHGPGIVHGGLLAAARVRGPGAAVTLQRALVPVTGTSGDSSSAHAAAEAVR